MNILVFSWRDPKHVLAGGAEQSMHQHMIGWKKAGHKVTLFSSASEGLKKNELIDDIKVIREGHQYIGVQIRGFLFYLKNKNHFDMVVDQFHGLPFFTPLYVKKPKLAVLQEVARQVWFLNPFIFPINIIVGAIGFLIEPFVYLFYRNVPFMVGSSSAKKDLSKYGVPLKNIAVVPHGVIVPPNKVSLNNKRVGITFLGMLSKDKGIEDAIYAFKKLDSMHEGEFWIIGKPEATAYLERLKKLVERLSFKNKVIFWGRVSEKDKFDLLSKSLILINPSIHEGWGLVNIEANYFGVPVVSYNSSGLVDSVNNGQSGVLVKRNTPEELAFEADRIIKDKNLMALLRAGSVKWSKKFDWKNSQSMSLRIIDNFGI